MHEISIHEGRTDHSENGGMYGKCVTLVALMFILASRSGQTRTRTADDWIHFRRSRLLLLLLLL
jgi:hypothetical protein